MRWPGKFPANKTLNGIVSHENRLPTFSANAGNPDIATQLRIEVDLNGRAYRNYIDGYNILPNLKGEVAASPRKNFW